MKLEISIYLLSLLVILTVSTPSEKHDRVQHPDVSEHEHNEGTDQHDARYDHDAFLGKDDAKRFDELSPDESKERLGKIVDKMDENKDGKITEEELKKWISATAKRYLTEDRDKQWSEYNTAAGGISFDDYKKKSYGDPNEGDDTAQKNIQEMISRDERRWKTADLDGDGLLNKDEFLAFLHPEESPRMRDVVIQETMDDIDKNKDGFIDEDEYIKDMWTGDQEGETQPDWVKTERQQFATQRDKNKDGRLDKDEVAEWILPKEYDHVDSETKHLFSQADVDNDGVLTKEEILNKHDVFVGSQATDYGEALTRDHEEL